MLSFGAEAFKIQRVWTGHLGRKLFRRFVVAIEEFRFAKASESNAIYKDRLELGCDATCVLKCACMKFVAVTFLGRMMRWLPVAILMVITRSRGM